MALWIDKDAYCKVCGSEDVVLVYESGRVLLAYCKEHVSRFKKVLGEED